MFTNCSTKYSDLITFYCDLNLHNIFNINFYELTQNNINYIDQDFFLKSRNICILDDVNIILDKNIKLRSIINNAVTVLTPHDVYQLTGWDHRCTYFNPIFNQDDFLNVNLKTRNTLSVQFDNQRDYDISYLNDVQNINIDINISTNSYVDNKILIEKIFKFILCGCVVNITDVNLVSLLGNAVLDRVNKTQFDYSGYAYSSSKILEKYSYLANFSKIDDFVINLFGNPYIIPE